MKYESDIQYLQGSELIPVVRSGSPVRGSLYCSLCECGPGGSLAILIGREGTLLPGDRWVNGPR